MSHVDWSTEVKVSLWLGTNQFYSDEMELLGVGFKIGLYLFFLSFIEV